MERGEGGTGDVTQGKGERREGREGTCNAGLCLLELVGGGSELLLLLLDDRRLFLHRFKPVSRNTQAAR